MPNPKPQSTYVVLDDSYEQEIRVDAKYKKQTTMEDKMWFGLEYTNKNTFLSKGTHFDEDTREKYGFNISGDEDENDKQKAEDLADKIYADSVKPDSLEDMTKYFQTLGTMKARMISLDGQYADSIEKALEGEEDKELKTQYLFTVGTENARMYSFSEYSYLAENSASSDLNNMIKDRIDLKTATFNDFAKAMNLDGIKIKNGDKKIYDDIKESFPNYNEIQIESKILESLRNTFVSWNKGIGLCR